MAEGQPAASCWASADSFFIFCRRQALLIVPWSGAPAELAPSGARRFPLSWRRKGKEGGGDERAQRATEKSCPPQLSDWPILLKETWFAHLFEKGDNCWMHSLAAQTDKTIICSKELSKKMERTIFWRFNGCCYGLGFFGTPTLPQRFGISTRLVIFVLRAVVLTDL